MNTITFVVTVVVSVLVSAVAVPAWIWLFGAIDRWLARRRWKRNKF